ncbi:hypothetical protein K7W42_13045 [Deinococcus sp. HMF7604]|uniref:hypothetical protein n=1 Tax=Deinococcus betulae TaxID=2873312 RepID=UPI001CCB936D|nr:hypothetical protein [Deinococcus betulae]MBZ9751784.1 hypothetical protein [Deinococcus betulae]
MTRRAVAVDLERGGSPGQRLCQRQGVGPGATQAGDLRRRQGRLGLSDFLGQQSGITTLIALRPRLLNLPPGHRDLKVIYEKVGQLCRRELRGPLVIRRGRDSGQREGGLCQIKDDP